MNNDNRQLTDIIRYFRVDRHDLVYLKFILEAYEGMSTLSTVDKNGVIVQLTIPAGFAPDMEKLIEEMQREITLTELFTPNIFTKDRITDA